MAYIISDACISCGACESECPVECISAGDERTDKELLQNHYPQNECKGIRTQQDKPHQSFRIQVCFCGC